MDKPHKKLDVLKTSMELSRTIYHITDVLLDPTLRADDNTPSTGARAIALKPERDSLNHEFAARGPRRDLERTLDTL